MLNKVCSQGLIPQRNLKFTAAMARSTDKEAIEVAHEAITHSSKFRATAIMDSAANHNCASPYYCFRFFEKTHGSHRNEKPISSPEMGEGIKNALFREQQAAHLIEEHSKGVIKVELDDYKIGPVLTKNFNAPKHVAKTQLLTHNLNNL